MASTLTSSSKFDPTKMSAPPPSVITLTIISLLIVVPMIVLSAANYGMLCIWLNSTVAALILLYHSVFLIVVFINRKSFASAITLVDEEHKEAVEDDSLDGLPRTFKPPSIAFNVWSLIALTFLFIANLIAVCIMTDVTVLGAARGTLPAERLKSQEWNTKVQIAQTSVIGAQLLTIGTLLGISAWGRRRIILEEEKFSEEERYII